MHMGLCGHPIAASHAGGVLGGILAYGGVQMVAKFWDRMFATGGAGIVLYREQAFPIKTKSSRCGYIR